MQCQSSDRCICRSLSSPSVLSGRPAWTTPAGRGGPREAISPAGCWPGAGTCAAPQVAGLLQALAESLLACDCSGWLQTAGNPSWQPSRWAAQPAAPGSPALPSECCGCPCPAADRDLHPVWQTVLGLASLVTIMTKEAGQQAGQVELRVVRGGRTRR